MTRHHAHLKKFVPALILHRLRDCPALPEEPESDDFEAAVLFADISGFSALTRRLTSEDADRGVHELARMLCDYIGRIVDLINEYGGDVVKFAGDALFAVWRADDRWALPLETRRAVQCGLEIQARLHGYPVSDDTRLAVSIAVGAGEMHALHLGGMFERWELVVCGDPMNQVSAAIRMGSPGEVIASPTVRSMLDDTSIVSTGDNWRIDRLEIPAGPRHLHLPEVADEAGEALRSYIPRAIILRLDEGLDPWTEEMRWVTVLFANVRTFHYGPDTPITAMQTLMAIIQSCLYEYYGSVNRFGVDDKGAVLLAAFGMPPFDYDDVAERGVRAARLLHAEMQAAGHDCIVGITTDRIFCGSVGNERRCEYTIHGTSVNYAARLMQQAESILCDENTYGASKGEFDFELVGPLNIKGIDHPVTAYRPT